jgi:hypothetical protein
LCKTEKEGVGGRPVKAIEGLLADAQIDSVYLQHLAGKIWVMYMVDTNVFLEVLLSRTANAKRLRRPNGSRV